MLAHIVIKKVSSALSAVQIVGVYSKKADAVAFANAKNDSNKSWCAYSVISLKVKGCEQ